MMGFASYLEDIREKLQSYSSSLQQYSNRAGSLTQQQNGCKDCQLREVDFLVRAVQNLIMLTDEYLELLTQPGLELAGELHSLRNRCKMLVQRNSNLETRIKRLEEENRALRARIREHTGQVGKIVSSLKWWITKNEHVLQQPKTRALLAFNSPPAVWLRELNSLMKQLALTLNRNGYGEAQNGDNRH